MPNPRLASRYAKALMDISIERNEMEQALTDMKTIAETITQSNDFRLFLQSPIIKADKKQAAVQAIFNNKIGATSLKFIELLISKGREANLAEVAVAFQDQYDEIKQVKRVSVTTASPMTADVRTKVINKAQTIVPGFQIEIVENVDPEIIGGFIIEVEGKRYDASVKKELNEIKKQFSKNIYVSAI